MRAFSVVVCVAVSSLAAGQALAAEDRLPVGSTYKGIMKRFGLPDNVGSLIGSYICRITITRRDEEKFAGELWITDGDVTKGCVIEGTVSKQGGLKFTVTKPLSKDLPGDVIGRVAVVGSIKDGKIKARYKVPNSANVDKTKRRIPRFGTLELKLHTEE